MTAGLVLGRMKLLAIVPRVLAALAAVVACVVAWRFGGGADASSPPPRASSTLTSAPAALPNPPAKPVDYEVSVRLVDIAGTARFDLPRADVVGPVMNAHGRQQRPPFLPLTGDAARFVTSIALRARASDAPHALPAGKERRGARGARTLAEHASSFDEREALVSPAPGSITFRVNVPRGAKLTFAEGTIGATDVATTFIVSVRDGKGALHEVHRHVLERSASGRWTDATCDLSAFAGQEIELRLATEQATASEPRPRPRAGQPPIASGGRSPPRRNVGPGEVRDAVALWGNPTILARTTPRLPYNVLWIAVDALRPDAIASFHDDAEDAAKRAAPLPPLDALLPKIPGLTPAIDDLAGRGVRFTRAYSAGAWTRPGTLAMLAGARSSELGIDTRDGIVTPAQAVRFHASAPPLLPLALRRQNVITRAFVNDDVVVGHVPVGIDMGFERVAVHRHRRRDTFEIGQDAAEWLKENKDARFFAFVSFGSPQSPHEPPAERLAKIPPPPAGPKDALARRYMAEVAKDDEAIGVLMRTLDETELRDRTIVIVTSGHGETLSAAHLRASGRGDALMRGHHGASHFEETTKIPIVIVAPGLLPSNVEVKARVRSTDLAPTVLDLLGLEPHARMSGTSLVPLAKGESEPDERVVVSEGRGTRAILHGRWRMLLREGPARIGAQGGRTREPEVELYDLVEDPGERRDLAARRPEVVAEMRARLEAALKNVPVAGAARGSTASTSAAYADGPPVLRLRFAGGGAARRVSGSIFVGSDATKPRSFDVTPVQLGRDAFHVDGGRVDVALRTSPSAPVGFDVVVDPPGTPVTWELWLDDAPWPDDAVFGGPFGLRSQLLRSGVATDEGRGAADATELPTIDPRRDIGLFVARERRVGATPAREGRAESAAVLEQVLRERGYLRGASATAR